MGNWSRPPTVMARPTCARLGMLISSPMMKSRKMRPISEITSTSARSVMMPRPR
jgi:hypothetical protein